jgi:hypothetical protein
VNDNFELKVNTNDPNLYGLRTVNLVVGFDRAGLTQKITETFSLTLIHPCKETFYSTTQTIADINYRFGDPPLVTSFSVFSDSVSLSYGITDLCAIRYEIQPSAI